MIGIDDISSCNLIYVIYIGFWMKEKNLPGKSTNLMMDASHVDSGVNLLKLVTNVIR